MKRWLPYEEAEKSVGQIKCHLATKNNYIEK